MRTFNYFFFTLVSFVVLNSCNKKNETKKEIIQNCRPGIPPGNKNKFVLTLSLNKCFKKVNQTIFIEGGDSAHANNFFVISAKVNPGNFKNGTYKNVLFKDFQVKKLSGNNIEIINASLNDSTSTEGKHIIDVMIKESETSNGWKKPVRISKLDSSDMVEIKVSYEGEITGPRICENYIGSLAK